MAYVISEECSACGTCIDECPVGAISEGDPIYIIDPEACTDCGACADACPVTAISEEQFLQIEKSMILNPVLTTGFFCWIITG